MPRASAWYNPLSRGFCSERKPQRCGCGRLQGQQHGSPPCLPPQRSRRRSAAPSAPTGCTVPMQKRRRRGGGETEAGPRKHTPASGMGMQTPTKACPFNCTVAVSSSEMEKPVTVSHRFCFRDIKYCKLAASWTTCHKGPIVGTLETFSRVHRGGFTGPNCSRPLTACLGKEMGLASSLT